MKPPVYIDRLLVEEGFLDGLDLRFGPGLNVLIGPRGVGKTSVIQLIRYCLALDAFDENSSLEATKHARAVLGADGRVSVRLIVDGEPVVLSRRRGDETSEGTNPGIDPIILAQKEIEGVGTYPEGRLRLLDGFRSVSNASSRERASISAIESLTIELRGLEEELRNREHSIGQLEQQSTRLEQAEREVAATQQSVSGASTDLQELDDLGQASAQRRTNIALLERQANALRDWTDGLRALQRTAPVPERWPPESESPDPLVAVANVLTSVDQTLSESLEQLAVVARELETRREAELVRMTHLDDLARTIRRRVESVQEGAGAAVKELNELRQRVGQLTPLRQSVADQRARLSKVRHDRAQAMRELDDFRDSRFEQRQKVAAILNSSLEPRISVEVNRSGDWGHYAAAITDALRGSGLHYSEIAPRLAQCLSPFELAETVEMDDAPKLAKCIDVAEERARRVIDRLRHHGVGSILTAHIEDSVTLKLLDGGQYKSTEDLSTGQRCTTVLPIVLRHDERPVILDQPEDHLDGAFIVETLVQGIAARAVNSQLIASTHNPNVPVLGNASRVTLLGSNGRRGYEVHSGDLDDPQVVEAITSVMEGGKAAFERRARFYSSRPRD